MTKMRAAISVLSLVLVCVPAFAETGAGLKQSLYRLNPKRDPGKPAYRVVDCVKNADCIALLSQEVRQAGGDVARVAESEGVSLPLVSGGSFDYAFKPAAGERFCMAVLLKVSVAPNFGGGRPLSRSRPAEAMQVPWSRFRWGGMPARAWFDGILILLSTAEADAPGRMLDDDPRAGGCKGQCETIRF